MVMLHFGVGIYLGASSVPVAPSNPGLRFHFRWILKHGDSPTLEGFIFHFLVNVFMAM